MQRISQRMRVVIIGASVIMTLGIVGTAFGVSSAPIAPFAACASSTSVLSLIGKDGKCQRHTSVVQLGAVGHKGPAGITGPAGVTGPAGAAGPAGTDSATSSFVVQGTSVSLDPNSGTGTPVTATASCPSESYALGGGGDTSDPVSGSSSLTDSEPTGGSASAPATGWKVVYADGQGSSGTVSSYVICAP